MKKILLSFLSIVSCLFTNAQADKSTAIHDMLKSEETNSYSGTVVLSQFGINICKR